MAFSPLTNLINAAKADDRPRVASLLDAGADPNLAGKDGQTPLYCASKKGHAEVVKLLVGKWMEQISGGDINATDPSGRSPLFYSSRIGDAELVKLLLEAGADPNLADKPLYCASRKVHAEVV